jgi:hypothetical protein
LGTSDGFRERTLRVEILSDGEMAFGVCLAVSCYAPRDDVCFMAFSFYASWSCEVPVL